MHQPRIPRVKPGQPLTTELWNAMASGVEACRIIDGLNVRSRPVPGGTIVNFDAEGSSFVHPWMVSLRGNEGAILRAGTVNTLPAKIGDVELSAAPAPVLALGDRLQLDAEGAGYIAVEVTYDVAAKKLTRVEIVQVADPDSDDGSVAKGEIAGVRFGGAAAALSGGRARWALARLRRRDKGRIEHFQIVHLNLTHRPAFEADGRTLARHFFY